MTDITRINEILADVLETTAHQIDESAAREFLTAVLTGSLRLEQRDVPASLAAPLMAAILGHFVGGQTEIGPAKRMEALQLCAGILFHAFNLASGGEADRLIKGFSKPARKGR